VAVDLEALITPDSDVPASISPALLLCVPVGAAVVFQVSNSEGAAGGDDGIVREKMTVELCGGGVWDCADCGGLTV